MKVGILTYHSMPNFGANLQALSTVCCLKNMGHEPLILNWVPQDLTDLYERGRIPKGQLLRHRQFVEKFLPVSELYKTDEELYSKMEKTGIEAVIVGSDAVLHHVPERERRNFSFRKLQYNNIKVTADRSYPNPFWGCFLETMPDLPAAIFSASSQNMHYQVVKGKKKKQISESLKLFDYISVRDEWTKSMIEYFTDNKYHPEVTPDPVFAFNTNVKYQISKEEILRKFNLPEKYILLSFRIPKVDQTWVKEFEQACKRNGYLCVAFPMPEGLISFELEHKIDLPIDVLDWYGLIKYSKGYVGERMHPIIVAMHNVVPFFCFDEYGIRTRILPKWCRYIQKSSKIFDILTRANLMEYYYSYFNGKRLPSPVTVLSKLLHFDRQTCVSFIENYSNLYLDVMKKMLMILEKK
jgi:hypothetical protein